MVYPLPYGVMVAPRQTACRSFAEPGVGPCRGTEMFYRIIGDHAHGKRAAPDALTVADRSGRLQPWNFRTALMSTIMNYPRVKYDRKTASVR